MNRRTESGSCCLSKFTRTYGACGVESESGGSSPLTCVCRALDCAPVRNLHITGGNWPFRCVCLGLLLLDRESMEGMYACSY